MDGNDVFFSCQQIDKKKAEWQDHDARLSHQNPFREEFNDMNLN